MSCILRSGFRIECRVGLVPNPEVRWGPTGSGAPPDHGPTGSGAHRIRGLTESLSGNGQALEITVVVAAAEIDGRPAMRLLKHSGKVLDSGESALCRNIADRQIGMVQ